MKLNSLDIYLKGLDAAVDGRGFGKKHLDAQNKLRAADDMLEALESARDTLNEDDEALGLVVAAIAKAKGETNG